jgi:hypothetical protein
MKAIFLILSFLWVALITGAQAPVLNDSIYNASIHTIQLNNSNWELGYPVMRLGSGDQLKLSFDDLTKEVKSYDYTLIHCNANWTPDNLSFTEYADGFEQNPLNDYSYSRNTIVDYIHYNLNIPNNDCSIRLSGNYILEVFEDNEVEKVVFTKRFFVVESISTVELTVTKPSLPLYAKQKQQFKLIVKYNLNNVTDPYREIKAVIFQNCNLRNAIVPNPTFVQDNSLMYDDPDENYIDGSNEFRNFDTKSLKYQSQEIKSKQYSGPYYTFDLHPDELRSGKQYFYDHDINGRYLIQNKLGSTKETDADYFMINFSLPYPEPLVDGDPYVFGALSDWQCNKNNKMTYDMETSQYKLSMLLKQGYFNYLYAYKPRNSSSIDLTYFEGNHSETENDYLAFVYYMPNGGRYQRLIGFSVTNSLNK